MAYVKKEKLSIIEIMLQMQYETNFPVEINIGRGTYKIKNSVEATFFSMGIMAKLDAQIAFEDKQISLFNVKKGKLTPTGDHHV